MQDFFLGNSVDGEHVQARAPKWKIIYDSESISESIFKKPHIAALFFQLIITISGIYLICLLYAICFLSKFSIIILVTHQTLKVLNTALEVCEES